MKTYTVITFIILGIMSNYVLAQQPDSVSYNPVSLSWDKKKQKNNKITENKIFKMTIAGVPLIAGGIIMKKGDHHFHNLRNSFAPDFRYHYDDYLQYTPAVLMVGLKAAGVKGRNSWLRMLTSDALSVALMAASVNIIKSTNNTLRPDGSARNSFPSGHTATAFMAATMLHKEYGLTRSPWYSIAGYSIATVTAISRQLNNRHWLSDVMVGAGIGILSTELGYFLADLIFKDKGITHEYLKFKDIKSETPPSFLGYFLGFNVVPGLNISQKNIKLTSSIGSNAGFEGAWFFNPYVGAGGRIRIANIPISLDNNYYFNHYYLASQTVNIEPAPADIFSGEAGAYFSYPFANRWLIGSKLLVGVQHLSESDIKIQYRETPNDDIKTKDVVNIEGFTSISMGTGISATYIANQNLSVRLFGDYNFIPVHTKFQVNDKDGSNTLENAHLTHLITFGASVNIQF